MKNTNISFEQYKGLVAEICRQISNSQWRPDYIVGITRGGLLAASMLSHYFGVPMHSLDVSFRDNDMAPESNLWMAEDAFGYVSNPNYPDLGGDSSAEARKNILIVDDMNDSGKTLNWIKEDWPAGCLPSSAAWDEIWGSNVRFAVVVNNTTSDFKDVEYVGIEVNKYEDPQWIVFPYEEWWL